MATHRTIYVGTQKHWNDLQMQYHTVKSIQEEIGRSRSWAYMNMAQHPTVVLVDIRTGKHYMAIKRQHVLRYLMTHPRGNPDWRR